MAELVNGIRFAVGSGLSDAQRDRPPAVGNIIRFRYQELTDGGVPRFPTYPEVRADTPCLLVPNTKGDESMVSMTCLRPFEFVEGT